VEIFIFPTLFFSTFLGISNAFLSKQTGAVFQSSELHIGKVKYHKHETKFVAFTVPLITVVCHQHDICHSNIVCLKYNQTFILRLTLHLVDVFFRCYFLERLIKFVMQGA
jgi:hypothetical protein